MGLLPAVLAVMFSAASEGDRYRAKEEQATPELTVESELEPTQQQSG